jgi:hypothetical protein
MLPLSLPDFHVLSDVASIFEYWLEMVTDLRED